MSLLLREHRFCFRRKVWDAGWLSCRARPSAAARGWGWDWPVQVDPQPPENAAQTRLRPSFLLSLESTESARTRGPLGGVHDRAGWLDGASPGRSPGRSTCATGHFPDHRGRLSALFCLLVTSLHFLCVPPRTDTAFGSRKGMWFRVPEGLWGTRRAGPVTPGACWGLLCSPASANGLLENVLFPLLVTVQIGALSPPETTAGGCDEGRGSAAGCRFPHPHTHRALLCTMSNVYLRGSEFSKSLRNNFFEMNVHRDEIFWAVPRLLGI